MEKTWENTIIEIKGILKTDENGKIIFTERQFGETIKYTATLIFEDDSPEAILARRNTWIFVDGIRQREVEAFRDLEEKGKTNSSTEWIAAGHLIRTPGKGGLNDLFNLKVTSFRKAKKEDHKVVDLEEALSKNEWQKIKAAKFSGIENVETSAPTAPSVPEV